MSLSSFSTVSIEEIAREVPTLNRWIQLYFYRGLKETVAFLERAKGYGFSAIVLTVDTAYVGKRRVNERNKLVLPRPFRLANFPDAQNWDLDKGFSVNDPKSIDDSNCPKIVQYHQLTWDIVKWIKSATNMKIVLKGIHCEDDAKLAVDAGVDAIWVSNHGGRQLDGVPATVEMLPDIVLAVQGSPVEVYVDGGVRTGSDVLKVLALGANAVFIGRPVLWGLACGGEDGVSRVLQILNDELRLSMALSGCRTLRDVTKSLVKHQSSFCRL